MLNLSIIFDLDGTLVDTLEDIAETANAVLAHHGLPVHTLHEYKHFIGDGLKLLIERITPPGTEQHLLKACYQMFFRLYSENWQNNCHLYDGIDDLLLNLKKQGIGMAVLSNKPHAFTKLFIERFFPREPFACVYGQRDGVAKKPDPTVALAIAERLGNCPRDMLFVGDSGIDIRTGKASGMTTVAVSWGFCSIHALRQENPDFIINSPMELLQYV